MYDFVQVAAWKGIITESLSSHLRAAIKKIFSTTAKPGEYWRDLPLTFDISDRIAALRTTNSGECPEKTIEAYHRRYDRSLRLFMSSSAEPRTVSAVSSTQRPSLPPPSASPELIAAQKILAASIKFQQEVLEAMSLITEKKGGSSSSVYLLLALAPAPHLPCHLPHHL